MVWRNDAARLNQVFRGNDIGFQSLSIINETG
jgi:hypothetical protein